MITRSEQSSSSYASSHANFFAVGALFLATATLALSTLVCFAESRVDRIHRKAKLVEETAQQWARAGKDPSQALMLVRLASQAFDDGNTDKGEGLLDQAIQKLELLHSGNPSSGNAHQLLQSHSSAANNLLPAKAASVFSNPESVTLQGYSGPQEDPVVAPDGAYLFFDSHSDSGALCYLYYAKRIDYKTFKFMGRIPGVIYPGVEGVEDLAHNFYFVSPVFLEQGGPTIGHGTFSQGFVSNIAPIQGLSPKAAPAGSRALNFDIHITPDGSTLYFSDFMIKASDAQLSVRSVQAAQLAIARKNADGSFTRLPNCADILKNVNALGSLVYNAAPSADGLELAFNASPAFPIPSHIYIATRPSLWAPFGKPQIIAAADLGEGQLSEAGSFSPDGKYLYFHRVLSPTSSQLYVLTRRFLSSNMPTENPRKRIE